MHPDSADLAQCRALIRTGSRSFYAASLLLPPWARARAYPLYAFCRLSDDLVDVERPVDAIERLRARLDAAYAGRPAATPVDRAFATLVAETGLPRALPEALLEGLAWDLEGVRCETLDDLHAYAARVAGAVGAMMTVLMGVRDADVLARACDLGVAMQLTNVARDVGEDARAGRLYLPRDWMRGEGIDPDAFLARPVFTPALGRVVARLLDAADALYARAASGVAGLPLSCRPGILAARAIYREIGVELARMGHDSVSARSRVSGGRKLALLAGAVAGAIGPERVGRAPPLPQTSFLVAAAVRSRPAMRRPSFADRVVWTAELFADLDRRAGRTA